MPWLAIIAGFLGLVWSADRFVHGSATLAMRLGLSKLMIGLTVVAFGTSAPEALVSVSSSLRGAGELAVGNALGSNLANVGLVLGITALVAPLPFKSHTLKQEFLLMSAVMAIAGITLWDGHLSFAEGLVLLGLLIPVLAVLTISKRQHPEEQEEVSTLPLYGAILWFAVGLAALIASAEVLVWGAKTVALQLGVSPLIVGLTIVAVGTSLPELAASIVSALKNHHDIAIGNVIGSNIFNLLLVMGLAPTIAPLILEAQVFARDYLSMVTLTVALGGAMVYSYWREGNGGAQLGRAAGLLLLSLYVTYYGLLLL